MKGQVEIIRTASRTITIEVNGVDEDDIMSHADMIAGDQDFSGASECGVEYEVNILSTEGESLNEDLTFTQLVLLLRDVYAVEIDEELSFVDLVDDGETTEYLSFHSGRFNNLSANDVERIWREKGSDTQRHDPYIYLRRKGHDYVHTIKMLRVTGYND